TAGKGLAWVRPFTPGRLVDLGATMAGTVIAAAVVAALVVAALVHAAIRTEPHADNEGSAQCVLLLTAWLVLPVAFVALASFPKPIVVPRSFAGVVPALVLALAAALVRLGGARVASAVIVAGVVVMLGGSAYAGIWRSNGEEDFRSAVRYVSAHISAEDRIAF